MMEWLNVDDDVDLLNRKSWYGIIEKEWLDEGDYVEWLNNNFWNYWIRIEGCKLMKNVEKNLLCDLKKTIMDWMNWNHGVAF